MVTLVRNRGWPGASHPEPGMGPPRRPSLPFPGTPLGLRVQLSARGTQAGSPGVCRAGAQTCRTWRPQAVPGGEGFVVTGQSGGWNHLGVPQPRDPARVLKGAFCPLQIRSFASSGKARSGTSITTSGVRSRLRHSVLSSFSKSAPSCALVNHVSSPGPGNFVSGLEFLWAHEAERSGARGSATW